MSGGDIDGGCQELNLHESGETSGDRYVQGGDTLNTEGTVGELVREVAAERRLRCLTVGEGLVVLAPVEPHAGPAASRERYTVERALREEIETDGAGSVNGLNCQPARGADDAVRITQLLVHLEILRRVVPLSEEAFDDEVIGYCSPDADLPLRGGEVEIPVKGIRNAGRTANRQPRRRLLGADGGGSNQLHQRQTTHRQRRRESSTG